MTWAFLDSHSIKKKEKEKHFKLLSTHPHHSHIYLHNKVRWSPTGFPSTPFKGDECSTLKQNNPHTHISALQNPCYIPNITKPFIHHENQ